MVMRDGTIRRTRKQKRRDDLLEVAVGHWRHKNEKWRIIPNVHGSAFAALKVWSCDNGGSLWHTFPVNDRPVIVVHGIWLRDWSLVEVVFKRDVIVVRRGARIPRLVRAKAG